jgi:hypothetical protein
VDAIESRPVPNLVLDPFGRQEHSMSNDQQTQDQKTAEASQTLGKKQENSAPDHIDGLKDKKPEELTPEELRLMADTMPGEGPGD